MRMTAEVGESLDGTGAGDHDLAYAWDTPRSYLPVICQARLTILRGAVMDARHGERGGAADGDLSYTEQTTTGLHVPTPAPATETMPSADFYDG
jgi:hypothetical protein